MRYIGLYIYDLAYLLGQIYNHRTEMEQVKKIKA